MTSKLHAQVLHSGDLICEGIIKLQAAPEAKKEDAKAKEGGDKALAAAPAAVEAPVAEVSKEAVPETAAVPVSCRGREHAKLPVYCRTDTGVCCWMRSSADDASDWCIWVLNVPEGALL